MSPRVDVNDRLTMPGYRPRAAETVIDGALRRRGAVLVEGCRGCGKTWAARSFARSEVRLDDEAALLVAAADPDEVLRGPTPRLLDEWQNAPRLWNRVRRECDDRVQPGQFILTSSASPHDDVTRHTGVGRISRVLMRPMSLHETGLSDGAVSLRRLRNKVGRGRIDDLAAMVVVTATGASYRRSDGIQVAPITALGP